MEKETRKTKAERRLSVFLFIFACLIAAASFIVPPTGVMDGSVLIFIGQTMLVAAGLLFGKNWTDIAIQKHLPAVNDKIAGVVDSCIAAKIK